MAKQPPLHEKFRAWLDLMAAAHSRLTAGELATRLGINAESYLYRRGARQRPGKFNSDTLDSMEAALGIPSPTILEKIWLGSVIDLYADSEVPRLTSVRKST